MVSIDCKSIPLALLLPAAIFAAPPVLAQVDDEQDEYAGESADRYAQVRVLEGEATIRKGDVEEALGTGTPVGEGDVVESRGRGVLQLGDGSRVAFDAGTRFTVAALFMDRQGERQVLLTLETGRLRISVGNEADTRVRVDSPLGSVSFGEKANVAVGMERHSLEVKVFSTRASVRTQEDQATLGAGEWLRLNSPKDSLNRIRDFNTYDLDDFEKWSGPRLAQRRSPDLDRVPEEIRPYAEELSGNGDWIYVDETQSYCWRPRGVSQDWRPYWRGRPVA
ncbi:FecR domain-containing protein [Holophaga foetida]|uniref:FecR domain-containing protein n=1 Tax=Holophaga foetida TaxID=35839 RepID=UPI00024750C2|nr:FecR domain-containing protein [Holophaga foetida]